MRIDRSLLNWGVFLIALGGVPLLVQQGWADSSIARQLWQLWPLILVGIGLGLILRWTPLAWLGGALVSATFGIIFGALIAGGVSGFSSACIGDGGEATSRAGNTSAASFSLDVELSCGELTVARRAAGIWTFDGFHPAGAPPVIDATDTRLGVRQADGDGDFFMLGQGSRNDWEIGLPTEVALTIGMTLNAASGSIDLGAGPFEAMQGTYNASDITIDLAGATTPETSRIGLTFNASSGFISLPDAALSGNMTLNASSLELCVPSDAELRISLDGTLSSDDLGQADLTQRGSGWQTAGFDAATSRIDLGVSSTVSSFSLDRAEVCP